MAPMQATDKFVKQLTNCQSQVYAFALSLLGNPEDASEVLQETNLILWQKVEESAQVRNFDAWALAIAYNNVRTLRRRRSRDRVLFDDSLIEKLAEQAQQLNADGRDRLRVLHECLNELPPRHRSMIHRRYNRGETVAAIARDLRRSAQSVAVMLFRIRAALQQCIRAKEQGQGA